jgi:hypothetical protein
MSHCDDISYLRLPTKKSKGSVDRLGLGVAVHYTQVKDNLFGGEGSKAMQDGVSRWQNARATGKAIATSVCRRLQAKAQFLAQATAPTVLKLFQPTRHSL